MLSVIILYFLLLLRVGWRMLKGLLSEILPHAHDIEFVIHHPRKHEVACPCTKATTYESNVHAH